jgi:2-keto-4-pentenoate hydratase
MSARVIDAAVQRGLHAQLREWRARLAAGEQRVGWKLGYMDAAARNRMGLSHPLVGYLTSGRRIPNGGRFMPAPGAQLLVEAELAVRLGRDVPADSSPAAALHAIDALAPAIELVDIAHPLSEVEAILACDLFHAAVALGEPQAIARYPAMETVTGRLRINDRGLGEVATASLPADPGALLILVAQLLAPHGVSLRTGDWIITGAAIKPAPAQPGDHIEVDLDHLGRVEAWLTE